MVVAWWYQAFTTKPDLTYDQVFCGSYLREILQEVLMNLTSITCVQGLHF